MLKKILILGFVCSMAFIILGCVSSKKKNVMLAGPRVLEPQPGAKIKDVPVPAGMKLLAKQSYDFENGSTRIALLKYSGKSNANDIVSFYKEQMAMNGWTLVNLIEYDQRLMNFEKDGENCIINIQPKWYSVLVTVAVGPKNKK